MKTLSISCGLIRGLLAAGLFSFGLQQNMFAPPATPAPTYYGETFITPGPDLDAALQFTEDGAHLPIPTTT